MDLGWPVEKSHRKLMGTLARIIAFCKGSGNAELNSFNAGISADPGGNLWGIIFSQPIRKQVATHLINTHSNFCTITPQIKIINNLIITSVTLHVHFKAVVSFTNFLLWHFFKNCDKIHVTEFTTLSVFKCTVQWCEVDLYCCKNDHSPKCFFNLQNYNSIPIKINFSCLFLPASGKRRASGSMNLAILGTS